MNTENPLWLRLQDEAREAHARLDIACNHAIDSYAARGKHIYCAAGCSGCCTLAVQTTFTEALCVERVLGQGDETLLAGHASRLQEVGKRAANIKDFLALHRSEIGSCPFLDQEGYCTVYRLRPLSCRSLLSTKESRWCATDFGLLTKGEKESYLTSLDCEAVSFPVHYLAETENLGRTLEEEISGRMAETFGFAITGNLPYLVFLERFHGLSAIVRQGRSITESYLDQCSLNHRFLISIDS
jgi:Fe-S-cluster containining protein